jgi:protein TonB
MTTAEPIAEETLALPERLVPPLERGQRLFRAALVLALLLHAAFFVEVGRSIPRTVGDRSGSPDAISVDIVTAADLASRETVALPPAGAPSSQPPAQAQETPQPAEPQTEPETPAPEPAPKAAEPQKPEPAEKEEAAEAPQPEAKDSSKSEKPALLPDFESALPDLATIPQPQENESEAAEPAPKQAEPAPPAREQAPPKKKPQQKQARLDPSPQDLQSAPPGRSASASRPPGITRSGENDEFGRGVVRALRMTMPPPRGTFGRVTVRLILTQNGDLAEVRVLAPSGTQLDQSVVFATKQTYFPLPPYNSTDADRTFTITYVYR